MERRRLTALLAIFAVAWASLWPLITAAHALAVSDEMPLCHQAGTMVSPDVAPRAPGGPASDGKTHCPLCIMAFFVAFTAAIPEPQFHLLGASRSTDAYCAPLRHRTGAYLPESRAPPSLPQR